MGLMVLIVVMTTAASYESIFSFRDQQIRLLPACAELERLQDDELLRRLYPDPQAVKERTAVLKRRRLSLFRNGTR